MRVETNISTPIFFLNENVETPKKVATPSTFDRGVNKVAPTTPPKSNTSWRLVIRKSLEGHPTFDFQRAEDISWRTSVSSTLAWRCGDRCADR